MTKVMLACGCAATATHENVHDGLPANHPSCPVHFDTGLGCKVVDAPDLTGRMARCDYYGKGGFRDHGPIYGGGKCSRKKCECEVPSSMELPFFNYLGPGSQHHRAKDGPQEFDRFFCGCAGWD